MKYFLLASVLLEAAAWNRLLPESEKPQPPKPGGPSEPAKPGGPREPAKPKAPKLCDPDIVLETCWLLDPQSPTSLYRESIAEALSATDEAVAELWKKLGFSSESVGCKEFCRTVVAVLDSDGGYGGGGALAPPSSDLGCYWSYAGGIACDLNVSKEAMATAVYSSADLPDFHRKLPRFLKPAGRRLVGQPQSVQKGYSYTDRGLLASVANLFRIYPRASIDLDKNSKLDSSMPHWKVDLQMVNEKATAAVLHAVRYMKLSATKELLRTWFGTDEDPKALSEIRLVLNSVSGALRNAHFTVNATCDEEGFSYGAVYPHGGRCTGKISEGSHCRQDKEGRAVVYLCGPTFKLRESLQMQVLVNHASKHAVAYREDVEFGGGVAHTRDRCKEMARVNTSKALLNADSYSYFVQDMYNDPQVADPCLWTCRLPGEQAARTCKDQVRKHVAENQNHTSHETPEVCAREQTKVSEMGECRICRMCDACRETSRDTGGQGSGTSAHPRRSLDRSRQWKVAAAISGVAGVLALGGVLILVVALIRFRRDFRRDRRLARQRDGRQGSRLIGQG